MIWKNNVCEHLLKMILKTQDTRYEFESEHPCTQKFQNRDAY